MAFKDLTPKQKVGTGVAAAVIALAAPVISLWEGRVLHAYPDAVYGWKVPTACEGHVDASFRPGQTFTNAECDDLRDADLTKEWDVLAACGVPADAPTSALAAVLSLSHNTGAGAVCRSTIVPKLRAKNIAAACATIHDFDIVGGVHCNTAPEGTSVCRGILSRRKAERSLCERGIAQVVK